MRLPFLPKTLSFLLSNSIGKDYQKHTDQWLAVLLNFNIVSIIQYFAIVF